GERRVVLAQLSLVGIGRGAHCRIRNVVLSENEIHFQPTNRKCGLNGLCREIETTAFKANVEGSATTSTLAASKGWARSDSSPSASAQYISASFRYWRLCRSAFATIMRLANSFAFARELSICDCRAETNAQAQTYVPRTARKEQIYDPRNLVPRLIRKALSGARAQGGGRAAEQRDELAASHHSITSSALACNVSGTVRPSAFAV